jgi:hypothetical protein
MVDKFLLNLDYSTEKEAVSVGVSTFKMLDSHFSPAHASPENRRYLDSQRADIVLVSNKYLPERSAEFIEGLL